MNFNNHSNLEGQHAFLGASKYHWINYSEDKVADAYSKFLATQKGTVLHAFAAQCISLGQKLPKSQKTLNMYVNDAIGYKMTPEQTLFYSENCFGTADSISYRSGLLRIHDLKTGVIPAHMEQLMIYMMDVYEDLDNYIIESGYDVRCFGYDPYNAKDFVERWVQENGVFGVEKVIQGAKTESVPLGELKKLSEDRMLLFDEELMTFTMGNCITLEDTNGNRKLLKKRYDQKIDAVAAMMDAYVAYKLNRDMFE